MIGAGSDITLRPTRKQSKETVAGLIEDRRRAFAALNETPRTLNEVASKAGVPASRLARLLRDLVRVPAYGVRYHPPPMKNQKGRWSRS